MDFFQYLTLANTLAIAVQSISMYYFGRSIFAYKNKSNENQIYRTTVVQNV